MAAFVHDDVIEKIIIGLDVKDLISCKCVCKSWHSLITSPGFINRHLNRSYNKDCCNNILGQRRITNPDHINYRLVGSSNGLVCMIYVFSCTVLVGNPLTREARQLRPLPHWIMAFSLLFWGFGYDASTNDYKVVIGARKGKNQTSVRVLSLKSNVWRVIEEVKYKFVKEGGILWNGALHWIVGDQNNKKLIISYDLSKDEFREIPHPSNARYNPTSVSHLGIIKGCLCIFQRYVGKWLMKENKLWELLTCDHREKDGFVHYLRTNKDCIRPDSFFHPDQSVFSKVPNSIDLSSDYVNAPIYVLSLVSPHVMGGQSTKSLVSPHVNQRPKRTAANEGTKRQSLKLLKES